jgi:hypothetical protein
MRHRATLNASLLSPNVQTASAFARCPSAAFQAHSEFAGFDRPIQPMNSAVRLCIGLHAAATVGGLFN